MSNREDIPQQMTLPFDMGTPQLKAEIISFAARKESILASQTVSKNVVQATESEILKRVLERADRLSWYK